ncbi:GNAT family N-acetyltransferase [Roseateles sp.]|uniref:GNAT family N-acetyltransferase n=1 Tax=Roseateles sp. TaxID=1971397 RepID=UPI0031DD63D2
MSSTLLIRPLTASDLAAWRPLWDGYNAFYGLEGVTALPEERTRILWERLLDERVPMHALVAELDGELVGLSHFLFHLSTTRPAGVCYLQDLFTAPALRGKGIGRALIEATAAAAKAQGSERLYWQTHETNATGRALYDRVAEFKGFIVYGRDV